MKTYQLLIGANNATKQLELEKIVTETSKYFKGFNIVESFGFWNGEKELTANVTIATTEKGKVQALAKQLKEILNQDAIAVSTVGEMNFI